MTTETLNDLERIGRLLDEGKIDQNDYALLKQQIIKGAQPELTGSSTEDSNPAPSVQRTSIKRRLSPARLVVKCPTRTRTIWEPICDSSTVSHGPIQLNR